jgi:hypothetical protein
MDITLLITSMRRGYGATAMANHKPFISGTAPPKRDTVGEFSRGSFWPLGWSISQVSGISSLICHQSRVGWLLSTKNWHLSGSVFLSWGVCPKVGHSPCSLKKSKRDATVGFSSSYDLSNGESQRFRGQKSPVRCYHPEPVRTKNPRPCFEGFWGGSAQVIIFEDSTSELAVVNFI